MAPLLAPVHPGEVLAEEFLCPYGLSASALASRLGVPVNRVTQIVRGQRAVTADTAIRLGYLFRTTPDFWLNLQSRYELELARRQNGAEIERAIRPIKDRAVA
jgi:addiction module HigA family antidote